MKKKFTHLIFLLCLVNLGIIPKLYSQATPLPYYQNFETVNDFTLNNGTQPNIWAYGSATGNTGKSLYISNDNGVTNGYNITTNSIVQFYKDFVIPAGTTAATPAILSFDWKTFGESSWDYLRVWMVPTTFTPSNTAQTGAGAGRIQIGGNLNQQANWQNYVNTNVNVSSFAAAGAVRLVFEWRNDGSGGTIPPGAVDNINFLIPTCTAPTGLAVAGVTTTNATFSWNAVTTPVPGNGYEYYLSTNPNQPSPTTAPSGTSATNSLTLNTLTPNTNYYWWVRSSCSGTDKSIWTAGPGFLTGQIPTTMPYSQDFSTANDFGLINGTVANKWSYGTATGNDPGSLYISDNNGVTNTYAITSTSVSHAYREFIVPAGTTATTPAVLSFNWKAEGQTTLDYFRVWLVPATYLPTAGTAITPAAGSRVQIGANFNQQSTWQYYINSNINLAAYAGVNMRLVFEWVNNNTTGTQAPAAIDNINLLIPTCKVPTAFVLGTITATNATISWTAPSPAPASGYQYYLSTNSVPPTATTAPTGTTTTPTITLNTLTSNTTYYLWVRSVCSTSDTSIWVLAPNFTTAQIPATLPYSQNFSTASDFAFTNGNQINKWAYGSATGNAANSIYISDDNGVSNDYNITTTSTVHAYRDITVPAGTTAASPAILTFDWKAQGQTTSDYLRVWLVPSTYNPVAGTGITPAAGARVQIGGYFNQQDNWQSYLNTNVNLQPYAGSPVRLVFEWVNNASTGTQTPAAVDNINLLIPTCKVPTTLAVGTITATNATFTWTAPTPAPGNGYQYYYSTSSVPPVGNQAGAINTTATTATITTLAPNTTYYWWVRAICSTTDASIWIPGPSFTTTQIPANIPYVQPFNTNDFGFNNGAQINKWYYGALLGNPANAMYISNDNGVTNSYTTNTSSVTHIFRDIAVPSGSTTASLSFDWKAAGESSWDYIRVWLVPATFNPTPGVQIGTGAGRIQVGGNMNQQTTWQTFTNANLNVSTFANQTMRLVFEWRNDSGGGTQPPAAIDNINLLICSKATPTVTVGTVTHNTAVLTWNQDLNGASYTIRYRPIGTIGWPAANTVTVAAAPYPTPTNTTTLTGLIPATQYEVEIAAVCNNSPGVYSNNLFTTKCDPTPPNVVISAITSTSALVTWNPLAASSNYVLRWRKVTDIGWPNTLTIAQTPQPPLNSYPLTGLTSYTTYEVQVANQCIGSGTQNPWSNPQVFTTDRVCQIAPPGLTITQLTPTTAQVIWDPFPGATYVLRYRKVGLPNWTDIPVITNNYTLTGLQELTKYEMMVANICSGTPGDFTPPYYFTTPTIMYCQMTSTTAASEYISGVTVLPSNGQPMINPSAGSTYTDYTSVPATFINLVQGTSDNKLNVAKNVSSGSKVGVAAWIDFNRNGYFDINERIMADGPNTNASATTTFSVPTDAFISTADYKYVVMRVALQKDGMPVTCENFADGEVEDYLVKISKPLVPGSLNQTDVLIYPNPVSTTLYVKNIGKKANYKIYSAAGQLVSNGIILNNKIDVSKLIIGVYVIEIEDVAKGTIQKKFIKEKN